MVLKCIQLQVTVFTIQVLDTRDNSELGMPPKPTEQLTGSGTELYNIDFDPVKLKEGAVVSQSTLLPSEWAVGSCVNSCHVMWCAHKAHTLGGRRELYEWPDSVVTRYQDVMKILPIKFLR